MNRARQWSRLEEHQNGPVDILVIGGGATGLGIAIDAATRGLSVVLVERNDFAAGTSSRSTKLIHGGVRYLRQGQVSLVRDSLRERGRLVKNAPGLVHSLNFVIPCFKFWEKPFYGMGMATYDLLAGSFGWDHSQLLSREETAEKLPGANTSGLLGGVLYQDGQFDDTRLALAIARTAINYGATVLNHAEVVELKHEKGRVCGAVVRDRSVRAQVGAPEKTLEIRAKVVVSAAGVFSEELMRLDTRDAEAGVTAAQGAHIVLDRSFFPAGNALMVPKTDDGRVLFLIPWHGHVLVGTTDTPVTKISAEPVPLAEEIAYLLDYSGRYLAKKPGRSDILSQFAGLRPLVRPTGQVKSTAAVSRDHKIFVSGSGLMSIIGGKWTTFRKMAEDLVDQATKQGGWGTRPCRTADLPLDEGADSPGFDRSTELNAPQIDAALTLTDPMIRRMINDEMAETVADVLARRHRALFVDASAAIRVSGRVSAMLASVKGWSPAVMEQQRADFERLALGYRSVIQ
jgi:glycerol-3-phosphate dehydrogenase